MKTLTNSVMLAAARRALAAHEALRPATPSECEEIAAGYRAEADSYRETAKRLRGVPMPPAEHGPDAVAQQHLAGKSVTACVQDALHLDALAARTEMHAEAWDRCSRGGAYDAALVELRARVAYYESLVAAERAAYLATK